MQALQFVEPAGWKRKSERFNNACNLFLENRNIILDGEPNFFDVYTKIIMNQLITHTGNIIPRNLFALRPNSFGKPFCCLPNDFNLSNHRILCKCILCKRSSGFFLSISLDLENCIANMLEINGIITLHRQDETPLKFDFSSRD